MTWLAVQVELLGGGPAGPLWPPPGRVVLVGPRHTFRDLATAIDGAFARWDTGHLWEYTLDDGRRIGLPDPDDDPEEDEEPLLDAGRLTVTGTVTHGAAFRYVFDLGSRWVHRCTVDAEPVDPVAVLGTRPDRPTAYAGWGAIPDQYGRAWGDDDGDSAPPAQPADPDPMLSARWPRVPATARLHGRDLPELRGATARRDREAVGSLLAGRDPGVLLQHAGEALLAVGPDALPDLARDVEARLRARGGDGDEELADALAARLGGTVPFLRPVPVSLDEVADLMSGDPARDTGGWIDLRTGETRAESSLDWMDRDERPDFDEEPDRWLFVDCEGSRETWRDRHDFASGLPDGAFRDRLLAALEGRGAFRRFAATLEDEPEIRAEWFAFGDERQHGRARALLAARGYAPDPGNV